MANTATVTSTTGPGLTATAVVLNDVSNIFFDFDARVVRITYSNGGPDITATFDYSAVLTVTFSISGTSTTVTIST